MIIPNAVGRLDPIAEAIRDGRFGEAEKLLHERIEAVSKKREAYYRDFVNASRELTHIQVFTESLQSEDFREQARRDCGWKGEE